MKHVQYRVADFHVIPTLAKIRSKDPATEAHWTHRLTEYLERRHHPHQALEPRIIFVATIDEKIVGFIAGHLTLRYKCDGELQWINVIDEYRRIGIASHLIKILAHWFIEQNAYNICVDPGNDSARKFYKKNGAINLNEHWMHWIDIRKLF
jgi:GNAT superfamily N-acetyltransferase